MPKRLCPFENDVCRQMKFHISQKEIDINSKANIEKVYSKTFQKLFNGAKACNEILNSKNKLNENTMPPNLDNCFKCTSKENLDKCWYCDKKFCFNCRFKCFSCQEYFCRSCSVTRYINNLDSYMCLNCC